MMVDVWSVERSKDLAREYVLGMGARWSHVVAVGQTAERLAGRSDSITDAVVGAAWVHDIGYAPELIVTNFHAVDGARALQGLGAPGEVVALVGHHTGAAFEARERGMWPQWAALPVPNPVDLDILTMIDLATGPSGQPMRDADRVDEILARYSESHPVHRAVSASKPLLLAASERAKQVLGLPDDWPIVAGQGVSDAKTHRGVQL